MNKKVEAWPWVSLAIVIGLVLLLAWAKSQRRQAVPRWLREVREQTAKDPEVQRRWRDADQAIREAEEKLRQYRAEQEAEAKRQAGEQR